MSEQKVIPLNFGEETLYWNSNHDRFQREYGGKYLMLLPLGRGRFKEIVSDDPHELRQQAARRGYEFPLINLVPRGNETEW